MSRPFFGVGNAPPTASLTTSPRKKSARKTLRCGGKFAGAAV